VTCNLPAERSGDIVRGLFLALRDGTPLIEAWIYGGRFDEAFEMLLVKRLEMNVTTAQGDGSNGMQNGGDLRWYFAKACPK